MIYFIQSGDSGPIKIGYSRDVRSFASRFSALQVGNPEPMFLRCHTEGDRSHERTLHRKLARHCVGGEWFTPARSVLYLLALAQLGDTDELFGPNLRSPDTGDIMVPDRAMMLELYGQRADQVGLGWCA